MRPPERSDSDDPKAPAVRRRVRIHTAPLLAEERLRQCSGFWLRQTAGLTDELDLAFPWPPRADSLPGLTWLDLAYKGGLPKYPRDRIGSSV